MSSRIIAIGDIHGCDLALRALVDEVDPQPDDTIVILGDCVDRGPGSSQVIDQLLKLRDKCQLIAILGNHEEMMLNYIEGRPQPDDWLLCGGRATLESYGSPIDVSNIPSSHVDFIRQWGDCFETELHFFVHAAYESNRPLTAQHWQMLRWHSLRDGVPDIHSSGRTAVVGHTSQKSGEILDLGHIICIDTYCWAGGWLTGLDVVSGRVWQADREGRLR